MSIQVWILEGKSHKIANLLNRLQNNKKNNVNISALEIQICILKKERKKYGLCAWYQTNTGVLLRSF